ncbi:MAG: glycoside hydrolase family 31 protein [Verrucomicrobiota bacterium]
MHSDDTSAPGDEAAFEKENYMESGRAKLSNEHFASEVTSVQHHHNSLHVRCKNLVQLAVTSLSPDIIKFHFAPDGHMDDGFSYAALPENFPHPDPIGFVQDNLNIRLTTSSLQIRINKEGLGIDISNDAGTSLSKDEKGFHWEPNRKYGGYIVLNSRKIHQGEHFFGLGDKSCHPEVSGRRFEMWGSDTYAYGAETDPLYKNIPFFIGVHHGLAYGIFFDNTSRTFFDFGKERKDVSSFWAQGGQMTYYFINGPTVQDVVRRFAQLTGVPELPPKWALGYHQCKWSYKTETELRAIADGFLKHKIPCDALYVDIDYMDGFRCFTWNLKSFPKPGELIHQLEHEGFKTVAIIDPGIKVDPSYHVYQQGIEGDHFCRQMDGDLYIGQVWPGPCHFPDFTQPRTREWWATLFQGLIERDGIAGIWNDMNEPADFNEDKTFPRHIRHDYDGHPCSHRRAHNVYGTQMIRATRDGLAKFNGGKRPFAITRSAYAGAWRYASAWTGDNISNWEHLRIANLQCQRLNLSGYSFVGSDIGGFLEQTNGELYTRWIQLGIFHPFCRTHSSGEHGDQEPWSFGEPYTSVVRKFIELRYRLLTYIYSAFQQHIETGDPILRPMLYHEPHNPDVYHRADEFTVGDNLLVCPICHEGGIQRRVYLPTGSWYEYWTDEICKGGQEVNAYASLDRIPLFVRAGTFLILDPVRQFSWESINPTQDYHLYLPSDVNKPQTTHLYHDEGEYYGYRNGEFHRATISVERLSKTHVRITAHREGHFGLPDGILHLHGNKTNLASLTVDGNSWTELDSPRIPGHFHTIDITTKE